MPHTDCVLTEHHLFEEYDGTGIEATYIYCHTHNTDTLHDVCAPEYLQVAACDCISVGRVNNITSGGDADNGSTASLHASIIATSASTSAADDTLGTVPEATTSTPPPGFGAGVSRIYQPGDDIEQGIITSSEEEDQEMAALLQSQDVMNVSVSVSNSSSNNISTEPSLIDPFHETDMRVRESMLLNVLQVVEDRTHPDTASVDTLRALFPWQDRTIMSLPVRLPFVHIIRFMMGPLYVDPHLSYCDRLLTYLHLLETSSSSVMSAQLYHENVPSLSILEPVQVQRYIRVTQSLHTLLRRMSAVRVRLLSVADNQTLQQVYTDRAVHEFWHSLNGSHHFESRTVNNDLRYTEALQYLRIWHELTVSVSTLERMRRLSRPAGRVARVVRIEIVLLNGWSRLPYRSTAGSYGYDLYASEQIMLGCGERRKLRVGINRMRMPVNTYMHVLSRSGMSLSGIYVANSPGLIDGDYRGPLWVIMENRNRVGMYVISIGDRIAQLEVFNEGECTRNVEWVSVSIDEFASHELEDASSSRGISGLGSTGH